MRFNCGPDMNTRYDIENRRKQNWHPWFAWRPVRLTGFHQCVWLEAVQRKGTYVGNYGGGGWEWEYKENE